MPTTFTHPQTSVLGKAYYINLSQYAAANKKGNVGAAEDFTIQCIQMLIIEYLTKNNFSEKEAVRVARHAADTALLQFVNDAMGDDMFHDFVEFKNNTDIKNAAENARAVQAELKKMQDAQKAKAASSHKAPIRHTNDASSSDSENTKQHYKKAREADAARKLQEQRDRLARG